MYQKNSFSPRSQYLKLSFIAIFLSLGDLSAQDSELIAIAKEKFYIQEDASGAVPPETDDSYGVFVFIGESSPGSILANPAPTLTRPGFDPIAFESEDGNWNLEGGFETLASLDSEVPNGTYSISFTGATSGAVSGDLTIEGDAYPNAPSLTAASFNALQSGSLSGGITLEWAPFQNGYVMDLIMVEIEEIRGQGEDLVFETEPFDLNGTDTSLTVPAGILSDTGGYQVFISFLKVVDNATIGGAPAIAMYGADTLLEIGDTSRKDLHFSFRFHGSFNKSANQVTTNIFPITNAQWDLSYVFEDIAGNFPDKNLVIIDGPAGSAVNGLVPIEFFGPDQGEGQGSYRTQYLSLPADETGLSGTYRVSVSDAEVFSKEVDFSLLLEQNLVVVPTINLIGGNTIQSIDIAYKTADNQDVSSTSFIQNLAISIYGTDNSTLYEEFEIPADVTNIVLPSGINWRDFQGLHFFYFTEQLSNNGTSYDKSFSPSPPDIFSGTDIWGFSGWKVSPWYLNYNVDFWPWIYHDEHGWQFVFESAPQGTIHVWDPGLDAWLFFTENTYRWMFLFGDNPGWIWCFADNTPNRRFFQRFDDGSLISVP